MKTSTFSLSDLLAGAGLGDDPKVLFVSWDLEPGSLGSLETTGRTSIAKGEAALEGLVQTGGDWDVIIAIDCMQRFYDTQSPQRLRRFAEWAARVSRLLLITPRRDFLDRGAFDLGPYRIPIEFEGFYHFSEVPPWGDASAEPVVALSNDVLFDGQRWHTSQSLSETGGKPKTLSWNHLELPPRTFFSADNTVIKIHISSPAYFEANTVEREARVLKALSSIAQSGIALPALHYSQSGLVATTLVRDRILGDPLDWEALSGSESHRIATAQSAVALACDLATKGVFHNDFRPWNLLQSASGLVMVDFADVGFADLDVRNLPQVVALAGSLMMILGLSWNGTPVRGGEHFDHDIITIVNDYFSTRSARIEDLYHDAWLALPAQQTAIIKALSGDVEALFDALFLSPDKKGER